MARDSRTHVRTFRGLTGSCGGAGKLDAQLDDSHRPLNHLVASYLNMLR